MRCRDLILFGCLCAAPPSLAQTAPATQEATPAEMRELIDAVRAGAKASRDTADHARVVPALLTQILAKLDKIEDKLDKVENAVKANAAKANGAARRPVR